MNRVLITGANGQLGLELQATASGSCEVLPYTSRELDVTRYHEVRQAITELQPAAIIHAAAYTDVDAAEKEPGLAEAVNSTGAANVARVANEVGARMIHVSTDFVFDGDSGHPYLPDDPPNPLSVYGRSKLAGEKIVVHMTDGRAVIVRTAWLYSAHGRNFVLTMLRLMKQQPSISVVHDQVGTPTWAGGLAQALWVAAENPGIQGIMHWTDAGVASWYDFAVAIQEEALRLGLLMRAVPILPINSAEFPRPARRPRYSVLDKTSGWAALGGPAPHWRISLRQMLEGLGND